MTSSSAAAARRVIALVAVAVGSLVGSSAGCASATASRAAAPRPPGGCPGGACAPAVRVVVVAPGSLAAREVPPGVRVVRAAPRVPEAAEVVAPLLERARTAYRDLAFDDALAAAGEAQVVLDTRARTAADFDAITQALLFRGMAELALGREARARDALRTVALLRPQLQLDEGRFAPDVRALYAELAAAVRADPPSVLTVTAEPADARVALDGRPVGPAPLTVQGGPGRHYLEVSALGHETRLLSVVLAPSGSQPLHVELPRATEAAAAAALVEAGATGPSPTERERAALRAIFGAAVVVAAVSTEAGVRARRLELESGASRELSAPTLDALLASLTIAPAGRRGPASATRPGDHDGARASSSWLASPWPWVVLGAVLTGVAVTSAVLVSGDAGTQIVLTPDP